MGVIYQLKEITTVYSHRFVTALLQWHNVYKLGEVSFVNEVGDGLNIGLHQIEMKLLF